MTSALLSSVLDRVLDAEGGPSNATADKGGFTNWGLTKPFLYDVTHRTWEDASVEALTRAQAKDLYTAWAAMRRLDQLPDHAGLAWAVIDFAVNSGARVAVKALQRYLGVVDDGVVGAETQGRWHLLTPDECDRARVFVIAERAEWFGRCLSQPTQAVFALGWMRRLAAQIRGGLA